MTLQRPQATVHLCGIFFMLLTLGFIPLIELPPAEVGVISEAGVIDDVWIG
jgi:hypothetical protein